MQTEFLFTTLNSIKPLSTDFKTYLRENLKLINYLQGEVVSVHFQASQMVLFMAEGLASGTSISNSKISTKWFSNQGNFIIPIVMKSGKPYTERIEFITASQVVGLSFKAIEKAVHLFPEAAEIFAHVAMVNISEAKERELFLRLSLKQRYEYILLNFPSYLGLISNARLASYINSSTRHFERLKNGK